jgi:hypothetical protein
MTPFMDGTVLRTLPYLPHNVSHGGSGQCLHHNSLPWMQSDRRSPFPCPTQLLLLEDFGHQSWSSFLLSCGSHSKPISSENIHQICRDLSRMHCGHRDIQTCPNTNSTLGGYTQVTPSKLTQEMCSVYPKAVSPCDPTLLQPLLMEAVSDMLAVSSVSQSSKWSPPVFTSDPRVGLPLVTSTVGTAGCRITE